MLVSIVTLNYRKKDLTISCITSLWEQYASEFTSNKMEVIIVDNDSQDDSVETLRRVIKEKKYANMRVIANSSNAGFGAGCNMGAKNSTGEFIFFLNNDTIVKDKGLIKMGEYSKEHPDIAILGVQLLN